MLANLMKVAGVDHVITIDLHSAQMQGFFKCPVDNLFAEPILNKWIRMNISEWWDTVVVSKNPGGTKRVTRLADKMGLSFGIVTTDQRKTHTPLSLSNSVVMESLGPDGSNDQRGGEDQMRETASYSKTSRKQTDYSTPRKQDWAQPKAQSSPRPDGEDQTRRPSQRRTISAGLPPSPFRSRLPNGDLQSSPLVQSSWPDSDDSTLTEKREHTSDSFKLKKTFSAPSTPPPPHLLPMDEDGYEEPEGDENTDERAIDVITGRLIHGHIVDDDVPSPSLSQYSAHIGHLPASEDDPPDHMMQSFTSIASSRWRTDQNGAKGVHALGGTGDATASDEEEEEALQNPEIETTVTLVGNVRDKPVLIVDDMIDKAGSWIAAAETVVKRGGATCVYCMATHALFGGDSLRELEECDMIEAIVVTNAFPIPEEKRRNSKKLAVLDVSGLLAEAIRRNHHGESISQIYTFMD